MQDENTNQTVERLTKEGLTVKVGNQIYSPTQLFPVYDNRSPSAIELYTLTGLKDFFTANIDKLNIAELLCNIEGPEKLSVVSKIMEERRQRTHVVNVEMMEAGSKFPFGQFMDHEDFCIKIKALFVENPDQIKIMQFASKLTVENNVQVQDDGVSQSAVVRKGLSGAVKGTEVAPVTLKLRPYRTFRELEQPESAFLFRMRQSSHSGPQCAIFEADGGAWRITALASIKKYLNDNIKELTVIA